MNKTDLKNTAASLFDEVENLIDDKNTPTKSLEKLHGKTETVLELLDSVWNYSDPLDRVEQELRDIFSHVQTKVWDELHRRQKEQLKQIKQTNKKVKR